MEDAGLKPRHGGHAGATKAKQNPSVVEICRRGKARCRAEDRGATF